MEDFGRIWKAETLARWRALKVSNTYLSYEINPTLSMTMLIQGMDLIISSLFKRKSWPAATYERWNLACLSLASTNYYALQGSEL